MEEVTLTEMIERSLDNDINTDEGFAELFPTLRKLKGATMGAGQSSITLSRDQLTSISRRVGFLNTGESLAVEGFYAQGLRVTGTNRRLMNSLSIKYSPERGGYSLSYEYGPVK